MCVALHHYLNLYCAASSQLENFQKSSIYFSSNTPLEQRDAICGFFRVTTMLPLNKYLDRLKQLVLSSIKDKIMSKIDGWKSALLFSVRKEVLIMFVNLAMPCYTMLMFKLPKVFCQEMTLAIHQFWWYNSLTNRGIH